MCKAKSPPAPQVMAPPPPTELPKPLGIDEDTGPTGVAQLRTSGRRSLSIRSNVAAPASSSGLTIGGATPRPVNTPGRSNI